MSRTIANRDQHRRGGQTASGAPRSAFTCPSCLRATYLSKKDARVVQRQRRAITPEHEVYTCPSDSRWFHVGITPTTPNSITDEGPDHDPEHR